MLEIIGELGSAIPWIYRGWFIILFKNYRQECIREWKNTSIANKIFDILMSLGFMVAEFVLIYYAYLYFWVSD